MGMSKYFGQRKDSNGSPLSWSGPDNFPFRGIPPTMLKNDEADQIPLVYDAKVKILTLPGQEKEYEEIVDRCANGWYQLRHERIDWNPTEGKYTIFLQWLEIYGEIPVGKSAWENMRWRATTGRDPMGDDK